MGLAIASIGALAALALKSRHMIGAAVLGSLFLLSSSAGLLYTSRQWADDLRTYAVENGSNAPRGPLGLRLVIRPAKGIATINGSRACVVRISERVILKRSGAIVTGVEQFEVTDCAVD